MKIDIADVVKSINKEIEVDVELTMDRFQSKIGDFPIHEKSPFTLKLSTRENKEICVFGEVRLTMGIACDRCLEEVPTQLHFEIDRKILLKDGVLEDEEMENTDYLIGFEMDVDKLVYAEILVNWPMKVLCKDDCEGICRVCGMNLNRGTCNCQRTELDPRMAAIQDIFNKFKEV